MGGSNNRSRVPWSIRDCRCPYTVLTGVHADEGISYQQGTASRRSRIDQFQVLQSQFSGEIASGSTLQPRDDLNQARVKHSYLRFQAAGTSTIGSRDFRSAFGQCTVNVP